MTPVRSRFSIAGCSAGACFLGLPVKIELAADESLELAAGIVDEDVETDAEAEEEDVSLPSLAALSNTSTLSNVIGLKPATVRSKVPAR